jgi:glycosyltransferase involved in cell wall biosynthesis
MELARQFAQSPLLKEVIIAGVSAAPVPVAEGRIKVCLAERPGRGRQMNLGAETASGDVLLFHHVDSQLTEEHLRALRRIMSQPEVAGGAFYRKFDQRHPHLRWLEAIERWHSRAFGTLYGDQSIFVRRVHFLQLGGFATLPLMEDVEFSRRLRRSGRIVLLDPPMSSSPARQIEQGAWRTTGRNMLFLLLFRCGVPADFLHAWYYRRMPRIVQGGTTSPTEGSPRRRALAE